MRTVRIIDHRNDGQVSDLVTPISQGDWEEVFFDSQAKFATPEVTAQILAGLYRRYSVDWPEQNKYGTGAYPRPGEAYCEREKAFVLAAQKVLGLKVVANCDGVYLYAGRLGWRLASCRIDQAEEAEVVPNPNRGCQTSSGRPYPQTTIATSVAIPMVW